MFSQQILPFRGRDKPPILKRRSASVGTVPVAVQAEDGQGKFVSLLTRMQRRKERGHIRSTRGIIGLGILSFVFGTATAIVETITRLKYPNASAALLSIETAGIFVGSLSIFNGLIAFTLWKTCQTQPKLWLLRLHKSLCNFNLCCAFGMFCLSLVALGIFTTLRDWQNGILPFLAIHDDMMKFFIRADLTFPYEYLEELVILKGLAMSFHLLIFLTSIFTSLFCLFNLFMASLSNFGGIAESVSSSFGSMMSNFPFLKRSLSKTSVA